MEKKTYQTPTTELIYMNVGSYLLNWSADKVPGGGGNVPEAKPMVYFTEDEEEETTEVLPRFSVWDD